MLVIMTPDFQLASEQQSSSSYPLGSETWGAKKLCKGVQEPICSLHILPFLAIVLNLFHFYSSLQSALNPGDD